MKHWRNSCWSVRWPSVWFLLVIGCSEQPSIGIVLDLPPEDSPAYPFNPGVIQSLRMSAARPGESHDLVLQSFSPGETIRLEEIPEQGELVFHLNGDQDAYGRTCVLNISEADEDNPPHLYFSLNVRTAPGPVLSTTGKQEARQTTWGYSPPDGSAVFIHSDGAVSQFDPSSDIEFHPIGDTGIVRIDGQLAHFAGGEALLIGGTTPSGKPITSVIRFTPKPEQVTQDGPALRGHAVTTLANGSVLAGGGENLTQTVPTVTDEVWAFRLESGRVIAEKLSDHLVYARTGHTMTTLSDGLVLVIGGVDVNGLPVEAIEIYRPFDEFRVIEGATLARWNHQAILIPGATNNPSGLVLIAGGSDPNNPNGTPSLFLYDTSDDQLIAQLSELDGGLFDFSVTPLASGDLMLTGGVDASGQAVTRSVLIRRSLNVNDGIDVIGTDSLLAPRTGHSAIRICDGTVLIAGGTTNDNAPSSERHNPRPEGRR